MTHSVLQVSGAKKSRDRQLPNEEQRFGLQDSKLGVEPVGAVGDRRRRRLEVTAPGAVAAREATHQGCDVGKAPELLWSLKPGADHPPVELLAGTPRKGSPRLTLDRTGRLPDQQERRAPPSFESGVRLGDDPFVGAHAACSACGLVGKQRGATLHYMPKLTEGIRSLGGRPTFASR
jgi:hypothetical protein